MSIDENFKCCICGEKITGCTVYDYRFDDRRTKINWDFCPCCSIVWAVPMINTDLSQSQVKKIIELAGNIETFYTHDDFYDEHGMALQPRRQHV